MTSARVITKKELRWACWSGKPTKEVEECRTRGVVEGGTGLDEEHE